MSFPSPAWFLVVGALAAAGIYTFRLWSKRRAPLYVPGVVCSLAALFIAGLTYPYFIGSTAGRSVESVIATGIVVFMVAYAARWIADAIGSFVSQAFYGTGIVSHPLDHVVTAERLAAEGDVEAAIEEYRLYMLEDASKPTPLFNAAGLAEKHSRIEQAIDLYREIQEKFAGEPNAWGPAMLREAHLRRNQLNDAKAAHALYVEIVERAPETAAAVHARKVLLRDGVKDDGGVGMKLVVFVVGAMTTLVVFGQTITIQSADKSVDESAASVSEAVGRIPAIRSSHGNVGITIEIDGGTHWLDAPLTFTPDHSGAWSAPVRIVGKNGARLSGGLPLTDWREENGVWVTDWYARAGGPAPIGAIWVNGEFREPARSPNEGYHHTAGKAPAVTDADGNEVSREKTAFKFNESDIKPWPDVDQAVIRVMHSWDVSHNRIATIEEDTNIANFTIPVTWAFERWGPKQRYIVQHIRKAFDAPGEWYLDQQSGLLYYRPKSGETMDNVSIVAPRLANVIVIEGDPAAGSVVEYVEFENLSIAHTNFPIPAEGMKDDQAAFHVNAAVQARGARHVVFRQCEVTQTSNYGMWFSTGSKHNRIEACRVHHLGAGGIRLGHGSEGASENEHAGFNTIVNCDIADGGYVFPEGVGVWIGRSSYNRVAHNAIHDFYYTGVSVGWSWGYADSTANHNTIEFNRIHDIGKGVLSDMGGVYLLGRAPGTMVRNNILHDIESYNYGGWGLYTDEGSSDVLLENNIVWNTKTGGFHQHYGRENRVQNNIFAFSKNAQIMRSREEDHISFYFKRNIVYFDNTQTLGSTWKNGNFVMNRNVYFSTAGDSIEFSGKTFEAWQDAGHDRDSIVADPKFANAKEHNFTLTADSPAIALGFRPIDTSLVGPRVSIGPR